MLGNATIEFKTVSGCLHAKSTNDHRWYKVQGITRTLDSMAQHRRRGNHNLINMDVFTRALQDRHSNPESKLDWVIDYIKQLNVSESKASEFQAGVLRIFTYSKVPSVAACRRVWDKTRMSTHIGVAVDADCKDVFNGKKTKPQVGPVSQLILTQLEALHLRPICGGLRVAGIPSPDRCSGAKKRYTYHNRCVAGCKGIQPDWGFYTEIDMVAYDTVTNTVALLELKTRHSDVLDKATLWRYNTQLWLTWVMFSVTYPSAAQRSTAHLVIVRPGTNLVRIRSCTKPTVSKSMRRNFPWLTCFCTQVLNCLAPTCVHMRSYNRSDTMYTEDLCSQVNLGDLSHRNICFNEEKKKLKRDKVHSDQQPPQQPTQRVPDH